MLCAYHRCVATAVLQIVMQPRKGPWVRAGAVIHSIHHIIYDALPEPMMTMMG